VLAIRAEMDALPSRETSGHAFASTNERLFLACGHDIHTTTLLVTDAVSKQMAPRTAGRVKLVFQLAE
jgi:metal-dependent amidase/aminoacylase/carboxypeptidase family protein